MTWKKSDANQAKVVEALRKCGFSVAVTSSLGKGFPDLVVSKDRAKTVLVELKNPNMPPSKQTLTDDEEAFHKTWKGKIVIAKSIDEIIKAF